MDVDSPRTIIALYGGNKHESNLVGTPIQNKGLRETRKRMQPLYRISYGKAKRKTRMRACSLSAAFIRMVYNPYGRPIRPPQRSSSRSSRSEWNASALTNPRLLRPIAGIGKPPIARTMIANSALEAAN